MLDYDIPIRSELLELEFVWARQYSKINKAKLKYEMFSSIQLQF